MKVLVANVEGVQMVCTDNGDCTGTTVCRLLDVPDMQKELEQLRAENARLTEIAAEKATRMDELYEALTGMLEQFGEPDGVDFINERDYLVVSYAEKMLNKNNTDGE